MDRHHADRQPAASRIIEAAGDFFRRSNPAGVLAAYVFGGHGEQRAHRESDVDIAVLVDRTSHPSSQLARLNTQQPRA
jgi:predicted nucleotidyltransferase